MTYLRIVGWGLAAAALLAAGAAAAILMMPIWVGWLPGGLPQAGEEDHPHGDKDEVQIIQQTRDNLRLRLERVYLRGAAESPHPEPYPRYIPLLGKVTERPGENDRAVTAPFAGTITRIAKVQGELVRPGDLLFTMQLSGESLQEVQGKLYKAALDLKINRGEQERLRKIPEGENLFRGRLLELGFEEQRLEAALDSLRKEMRARLRPLFNHLDGPDPQSILQKIERETETLLQQIEKRGEFVADVEIRAFRRDLHLGGAAAPAAKTAAAEQPLYEMEGLRVQVGSQVAAGDLLCRLSNHEWVYLVGQAFEQDVPLLQQAIEKGYTVRADFREGPAAERSWPVSAGREPPDLERLHILHLSNIIDDRTKTFPFVIRLRNQFKQRTEPETGRTYLFWRFRVDQPVRLDVQVDEFSDVFVVPTEAVVRDGADTFVFRVRVYQERGTVVLQRRAVHVVYEDAVNAVLANDGSLADGSRIALNGAAALNRILKSQRSAGQAHGHSHSH